MPELFFSICPNLKVQEATLTDPLLLLRCPVMSDSVTPWSVACHAPLSMEMLQARIQEWVAMPCSRGIVPTQGLNPGLPHCSRILYHLMPGLELLALKALEI